MSTSKIARKILIVDDHKMIVDGLKLLLSTRCYQILEAYHLERAITLAKEEQPDLAIVDYRLDHQTGDQLVRELKYHSPQTRILGYSYSSDEASILHMADAGLHGFVLKSDRDDELTTAVDMLLDGKIYFDELSRSYLTNRLQPAGEEGHGITIGENHFTCKEVELIRLMSKELSAKEISKQIFLSERTVEQYKSKISKKIGAKNVVGVLKYALKFGLIKPEEL